MRKIKSFAFKTSRPGIASIRACLLLLVLVLALSFAIPNIKRAHHTSDARKIVAKIQALTQSLSRYNLDTGGWPPHLIWGQVSRDLEPYLPIGTDFSDPSQHTIYSLTNYTNKSKNWGRQQGYQVALRVRVNDMYLAKLVQSSAPNLFSEKKINQRGGSFVVVLE